MAKRMDKGHAKPEPDLSNHKNLFSDVLKTSLIQTGKT
jgi:hypothetical protein